ncbi:MAG: TatD family hydrolase [Acidobacteriota bacterium]|nr:MAG: TatD family hydrolase [Acidobacteriota bacterium]
MSSGPRFADLVDAHAHLADPAFDQDRAAVLERASAVGVRRIVTVGETPEDAQRILQLAAHHREIAPAIGLYPTHLEREKLDQILALIRKHQHRLIGVGEIGLDRWVVDDERARAVQREMFLEQVRLAIELDLPVNVHSRSAGRYAVAALVEAGARRVLLHAFDGRASAAEPALQAGYFFSVPPSIVRSRQKQKLVRALPLDRLLLETDSPVLGADPRQRNEPSQLVVALDAIAEIKRLPRDTVARATTENAVRLFGERVLIR